MDHHQTDDAAEEQVAAEDARRGNGNENRQEGKCGVGRHVEEGVPVGSSKCRNRFTKGLDETHHKTGRNDGRQDGDEDVARGLEEPLPQRGAGSGGLLNILLRSGGGAGDGQELVIHFVDGTGTNDELELSVGLEHTLHAINFFKSSFVDLRVVRDDQAEPGRAVCSTDDVGAATNVFRDFLCTFSVIQCHTCFLP